MKPSVLILIAIFLGAGLLCGWFAQRSWIAHGDVKVARTRVRGGRRTRWRAGLWALLIAIFILLAVKDVAFPNIG